MKMFFVAGIGIAVFIEFLLISKKNKSTPDRILTVWMFVIILHLFLSYLFATGDIFSLPFLLGIEQPFPLLHGIFLYFYVAYLTDQLPDNRKLLFLHALPPAAVYLYLVTFFILPPDQKIYVYRSRGEGYEVYLLIKRYAIWLSGILYVTWSEILLRRHRKTISDQFSDLEKVNLQWLKILTYGMGCIWLLVIFFENDRLIMGGVVVFVFLIGFFGVRQTVIFSPREVRAESDEPKRKYPKSGLSEEAATRLHESLIQLMTGEALYKKSDLSINDLASRLGVHANYLSQIINQKERKNFYDFVNTYRFEEFRRLISLQKNQQYTLLSLAHDCGFSSKSSFNRYFKKATGQTPSEYSSAPVGNQPGPA